MEDIHYFNGTRGKFAYRQLGPEDGRPLVLLHGWPESGYCWKGVAAHISPEYRLIIPDLRGLGDSERSLAVEAYAKDQLALDIMSLLDHLDLKAFFLVGHDWGGAVAQEMAWAFPDRIRKLVLINISIINNLEGNLAGNEAHNQNRHFFSWYQHFQQQPHLPEAMIPGNEAVWLRHFLRAYKQSFPEDAIQEYIRCYQIPGTAASGANYYRSMTMDIKRWKGYAGIPIQVPSLYVHGSKDRVVRAEFLQGIESCFQAIAVKSLEAGHFLPEEQAQALATILEEFFQA